jgi:hypothetical protein
MPRQIVECRQLILNLLEGGEHRLSVDCNALPMERMRRIDLRGWNDPKLSLDK